MGQAGSLIDFRQRLEERVLHPLTSASRGYWILVGVLSAIVALGIYAYSVQARDGLWVTGMRDRITWGLYITNFIFFTGIGFAGTLISAALRVVKADWRVPITRMAEFITVIALAFGALMPFVDLGRPDRVFNLFIYGRWQAPITWDLMAITTYITGSAVYLYLPLIPDFARARDQLGDKVSPLKAWFFRTMAIGWQGLPSQWRKLHMGMGMMMILILPVAVTVHTVVSWIFAMTLREQWNNPAFGAFFVAGAIYSGIGILIILMVILRKVYHLEEYITKKHFTNLGYMLATLSLVMMYFNMLEYVSAGFKLEGESKFALEQLFTGYLAPYYWTYAIGGLVVPGLIILFPQTRNIRGITVAAAMAVIGMWIERFFIVVGGLRVPTMPYEPASYTPSWVELSITAGTFAGFALVITLVLKFLPAVAMWEVEEQYEQQHAVTTGSGETTVRRAMPAVPPSGGQER